MLTKKENFVLLISIILFGLLFAILLHKVILFEDIVILTLGISGVIKSIYDIKYRTGYKGFYSYSEETNQKFRYLVSIVIVHMYILIVYFMFDKYT